MSAAAVLQLPSARYAHIQRVVAALEELCTRGELSFPTGPPSYRIEYDDAKHYYWIDGQRVPSATGILDGTEVKAALTWWGFRVGMAAVIRALQAGKLTTGALLSFQPEPVIKPDLFAEHPDVIWRGKGSRAKLKSRLEALVQDGRWDPYNIKTERGTVGDSVHKAAEKLQLTGEIPTIEGFPTDDQGYVQALARYWNALDVEVEQMEQIVGSKRFGYAGRFDKIVRLPSGQRRMRDYKTSGGVYGSFDKQLSLYDIAHREMGFEPVDGHDVVHLRPDGTFEVVPVTIDHADALVALLKLQQDADQAERLKALGRKP